MDEPDEKPEALPPAEAASDSLTSGSQSQAASSSTPATSEAASPALEPQQAPVLENEARQRAAAEIAAQESATLSPEGAPSPEEEKKNLQKRQVQTTAKTVRATDPYSGPEGPSLSESAGPYPEPLLPPPPPPAHVPRTVRLSTAIIIGGLIFLLSTTSAILIALYASAGGFVPFIKHLNAPSTATTAALTRRVHEQTPTSSSSLPSSPTASSSTITATVTVVATATAPAPPTVIVVGPTPTAAATAPYTGPTADTLLHAFIANYLPIACSADGGCIRPLPPSWWLSWCEFYPAHGSYQFYDTSGGAPGLGTEMIVAVFQTGAHAKTVLDQLISSQAWVAPHYAIVDNCALLTENINALTDWNQYIAIMQQLC